MRSNCLCLRIGLKRRPCRLYSTITTVPADAQQAPRPSIAPKPILDIKHIRQHPDQHAKNCYDRNYKQQSRFPSEICRIHDVLRATSGKMQGLREEATSITRDLKNKALATNNAPASADTDSGHGNSVDKARAIKAELSVLEDEQAALDSNITNLALQLPNLTSADTPIGSEPKLLGHINAHPDPNLSDQSWKSHVDIGTDLQLLDFTSSSTSSGWGFYYLLNNGALLEQALIQYALSVALKRGFTVVSPPSLVYSHISAACGFQPRDQNNEQQVYLLQQQSEKDVRKPEMALAGTAEIPLAAMQANKTITGDKLPLKTIAVSRCYRAEAGARGVDTKGLYRVHEFTKVEMFGWTLPDEVPREWTRSSKQPRSSLTLFHEMLTIQKEILQSLNLHCRVLEMPSTDLGASAFRKIDIEAFFPSRRKRNDGWGEVTSLSNCTDYQTRRLATRIRHKDGRLGFPHTVNGTAMAVPRVLAAIMEHGWDADRGVIHVPEVLRPWMHGVTEIGPIG